MPQGTPRRTFASLTRQHTSKNTFTAARLAKSLVELKEGKGETEAINASVRSGGSVVSRHPQERQFLADYLRDQFPQWLFELNAGFNLCFYGYGSKKELMEAFVQEMCLDGPTVVVYGYAASASIKEILTGLLDLLGIKVTSRASYAQKLEAIRAYWPQVSNEENGGEQACSMPFLADELSKEASELMQDDSESDPEFELEDEDVEEAEEEEARGREVRRGRRGRPQKKPSTTRPWRISRVSQLSGRSRRIPRLYLLIHNLDGPGISSPQAQEILLSLASIPNISLLASVDHINAGLLLNPGSFASTSFLFHDATTFTPYITEQSAHASLILRLTMAGNGSASVNKHSAQLVLASLTDNARDLFRMLGKACIDSALTSSGPGRRKSKKSTVYYPEDDEDGEEDGEEGSGTERGITYEELFSRCRSAFIVNSEATFKSILGEFRDHELLTEIRGSDGSDVLSIPLTMDDLKDLCAPGGM